MSWTNEKVEKLKELWSKGHTASQIAEAFRRYNKKRGNRKSSQIKFRSKSTLKTIKFDQIKRL